VLNHLLPGSNAPQQESQLVRSKLMKTVVPFASALLLVSTSLLSSPVNAQWDMVQGKVAAKKAVEYVIKLCGNKSSCLSEVGLNTDSTEVSARDSGIGTSKAFAICDAGFGQGDTVGFVSCVNYLRGMQ